MSCCAFVFVDLFLFHLIPEGFKGTAGASGEQVGHRTGVHLFTAGWEPCAHTQGSGPRGGTAMAMVQRVPESTVGSEPLSTCGLQHLVALQLWLLASVTLALKAPSLRAVVRVKVLSALPGTVSFL